MAEESIRKAELIAASKAGDFLDAVYKIYLADREDREVLALDIAALHNDGYVDVVSEYEKLDSLSGSPDFFMMFHIFAKTLPHINASVSSVMRSVLHLNRSAGQDLVAGIIFDAFIAFCAKDPVRPREALRLIEAEPSKFMDMLPMAIATGSQIDFPHFLREVIRLSQHPEMVVRQRALFALSKVQWPKDTSVPEFVISALEKSATEADNDSLSSLIISAFTLYQQDKNTELRITSLIDDALSKGDDSILHSASIIFGYYTKEMPPVLLDLLLEKLKRVEPTKRSTLSIIDSGLASLLKGIDTEKGLRFLDEYLLIHSQILTIKVFDSAVREIRRNRTMLNKVITRWLLNGAYVLCDGAHEMAGTHYGDDLVIEIDPDEVKPMDLIRILFIARKAIGYFFMEPVTAVSIVISLMRNAPNDKTLEQLSQLLFDPLLVNYPGCATKYVETQATLETGKVKEAIENALTQLSSYLEVLRSVPVLPALHPSQAHRESYRRYMSEMSVTSFKAAEKESVLSKLCTRQTLLYGMKSIDYIHAGDGELKRMETPLISRSVEMEIPRMDQLDKHGLNFMLWTFRRERIRS